MSQTKHTYSIHYPRLRARRRFLRVIGRGLMRLLTRTKIEGLENIPEQGPVILAGNHAAYLEPVLMSVFPKRLVEPIGAGDFPFEGGIGAIVSAFGFIPINRGNLDRKGLNQALDVLRQDGVLGIFPEGGTWAPGKMPPQIGVALLSQRTGAPVVPIGFSGLQGVMKKALQLKRPKILMRVGEPITALPMTDAGNDKSLLLEYSHRVLDAIYDLISQDEQNHFPIESSYELLLEHADAKKSNLPGGNALAHFLHSPVLLDSLKINLKLPVEMLYEQAGSVDLAAMQDSLSAVMDYLKVNPAFFTYRLGMEEGSQVAVGIRGLLFLLDKAKKAGKRVRIHTREDLTYKDGRLESNQKRFVIEPGSQQG